eukprot:TRINITY_DN35425_c0_g2_i1.p1 TRINITY_DN35425_c0_g2~~TRINITY_DN35425_c0_g2_i1.p1  ORF type:complete len:109 (+),score=25.19 TRINITY_DN35425_c0_g2_i1:63-389(+)
MDLETGKKRGRRSCSLETIDENKAYYIGKVSRAKSNDSCEPFTFSFTRNYELNKIFSSEGPISDSKEVAQKLLPHLESKVSVVLHKEANNDIVTLKQAYASMFLKLKL